MILRTRFLAFCATALLLAQNDSIKLMDRSSHHNFYVITPALVAIKINFLILLLLKSLRSLTAEGSFRSILLNKDLSDLAYHQETDLDFDKKIIH